MVERQPPKRLRGRLGFDPRSVALTPASVAFLTSLGGVERAALTPIETMRVWECDGTARLNFSASESLASVGEHSALTTSLWRTAASRVEVIAPAAVADIVHERDAATVVVDAAGAVRHVSTRLVIGADGAAGRVRALTGVAVRREAPLRSGPQCAVATVARTVRPHANVAWQRFGATGPVALLPLPDERSVAVIWSSADAVGRRLRQLDDDAFRAALDDETEGATGGFEAVDRRFSFPVEQTLAANFNPQPRVVLAGDAAHTLHPLAGQGVNLGLEDARALAASAPAADLGAPGRWTAYARRRRMRAKAMMALMRGLLAAYCGAPARNPWMRLARNAAIRRIDASEAVKAQLVREAMGFGPLAAA